MRRFSLLFDLDGTLVDSDALHLLAFAKVLQEAGVAVDEAYYRSHIAGRANDLIIAEAFPTASREQRIALAARKETIYRHNLAAVRIVPGAREIIGWAKAQSMQCAIVTTSPRISVEAVLNSISLIEFFDPLVVGDEVRRGKPDPLPYLTALLKLGIDPGHAVAFEDSLPGLASATGAGIPTVAMLASLDERTARLAGAVRTAKDFLDVELRSWLEKRRTAQGDDQADG